MINHFVEVFMKSLNRLYEAYYEEAPNTAKYPYLVVPTINVTPLSSGYLCLFDIEIYIHELTDITVEEIMDRINDFYDGYRYRDTELGYHISIDNRLNIKSVEQDLIVRRISLSARIFR